MYATVLGKGEAVKHELKPERHAYVQVARGSVEINATRLDEGDGARVRGETELRFTGGRNAEVLVFNLRPHDLPQM